MTAAEQPLRMTVDGIELVLPHRTVRLPDGDVGYFQTTNDPDAGGCFAAALATLMQVPLEDLGRMHTLRDLAAWADPRGLDYYPCDDLHARRWMGFADQHVIVGTWGGRIYFDPASGWMTADGRRGPSIVQRAPEGLQYAVTLEPKGTPC